MPRFAANLSMLFTELPFLERFAAARAAGFSAVEYLFPYAYSPEQLSELLRAHRLQQALFNTPAGDWESGQRGFAAVPGAQAQFRDGFLQALEYQQHLANPAIHLMAGIAEQSALAEATYIDNLSWAAEQVADRKVKLLIEPINTRDMPGYYLNTPGQAVAILDRIGSDKLGLQFDFYHVQIMCGDLLTQFERYRAWIGHCQIASVPGRHEPDEGEINYPYLFTWLDRLGYRGYIGCEYRPAGETLAGLNWFKPYRVTR